VVNNAPRLYPSSREGEEGAIRDGQVLGDRSADSDAEDGGHRLHERRSPAQRTMASKMIIVSLIHYSVGFVDAGMHSFGGGDAQER